MSTQSVLQESAVTEISQSLVRAHDKSRTDEQRQNLSRLTSLASARLDPLGDSPGQVMPYTDAQKLMLLQSMPLLAHIPTDILVGLTPHCSLRIFRKNDHLCHPDYPSTVLLYLLQGLAHISVLNDQGQNTCILLVEPQDWYSDIAIAKTQQTPLTILAAQPSLVLTLAGEACLDVITRDSTLLLKFLTRSQQRFLQAVDHIQRIHHGDAFQRIARVFLALAQHHGEPSMTTVRIRPLLTHQTLADMAGLSRATTSTTLSIFRQERCLDQNRLRQWEILDMARLKREAR